MFTFSSHAKRTRDPKGPNFAPHGVCGAMRLYVACAMGALCAATVVSVRLFDSFFLDAHGIHHCHLANTPLRIQLVALPDKPKRQQGEPSRQHTTSHSKDSTHNFTPRKRSRQTLCIHHSSCKVILHPANNKARLLLIMPTTLLPWYLGAQTCYCWVTTPTMIIC